MDDHPHKLLEDKKHFHVEGESYGKKPIDIKKTVEAKKTKNQ